MEPPSCTVHTDAGVAFAVARLCVGMRVPLDRLEQGES